MPAVLVRCATDAWSGVVVCSRRGQVLRAKQAAMAFISSLVISAMIPLMILFLRAPGLESRSWK